MSVVLNLVYALVLLVASPGLLLAAWRHGKYRQGWREKLWGAVPRRDGDQVCLWFHAVSLGEVNLLATLLEEVARRRPDVVCYLTTTTRTGYEAARRRYPGHPVSYCPLDFSWAVRRAAKRIRPDILVLAELELWPNLIRAVRAGGGRVAIVNGRLSHASFRGYRRIRWFVRRVLRQVELIAVQSPGYRDRFLQLGADPTSLLVTGSLKFDGAGTDRHHPSIQRLRQLAAIDPGQVIWLAGSTFPPEEDLVVSVYRDLLRDHPNLRLILVPRHPERFDFVAELLAQVGLPWIRRSQLNEAAGHSPSARDWRVLLVDTVGELGAWWGVAQIAFVGGSMGPRGGQNMIEPAGYGAAVCFGPKTANFRDVVQLMLPQQAATVVRDAVELRQFVEGCLQNPGLSEAMGQRAQLLVRENAGATRRTLEALLAWLPPSDPFASEAPRRCA